MKFVSWNLNVWASGQAQYASKAAYLAGTDWDVAALQEVSPEVVDVLGGVAESVVYRAEPAERYGSALLARNGVSLSRPAVIPSLPVPSRGVSAEVELDGRSVTVCSWHPTNAAKEVNKPAKRAAYVAFNDWVCARTTPLLVGTDANHGALWTRVADFPHEALRTEFARDLHWEENLFWTAPQHDLSDAWMLYLEARPDELARVRAEWERLKPQQGIPEPGAGRASAVTHVRGQGRPGAVLDRFDYVLISPELRVVEMAHDFDGAVEAGSDHAVVWASIDFATHA